jgi:lysine 2,3-aminomutase
MSTSGVPSWTSNDGQISPRRTLKGRVLAALSPTDEQWDDWKWHFRHRITSLQQLSRFVVLEEDESTALEAVIRKYPFSITPYYLSLATEGDRNDSILRQSVPTGQECELAGVGEEDPLEERCHSPVPGLVHRYPDRALLVLTNVCPVLCRFCSRKREWAQGQWIRSQAEIDRAVSYIRSTEAIRDIIISGGDPLTLDNARLARILKELRSIPHLEIIRIGSRFPVVLPQRIDEEFCRICDRYGPIWLNTHFNHPNEVTPEAAGAVRRLLRAGVPVNNQSVLLRGVNDNLETQRRLSHELLKIGVRPYYLYQADEVRGTEHFWTPIETGLQIVEGLIGHTSGLGIPAFVVDVAGGGGKIPLQPNYVLSQGETGMILRNFEGRLFSYRNLTSVGLSAVRLPQAIAMDQAGAARELRGGLSHG